MHHKSTTLQHYNLKIKGKVQGVSFRVFCKKAAHNLQIKGFAKNLSDGSVYIEIEGLESDLHKFVDMCHIGSPRSHVESVEIDTGIFKYYESFQIKN